MRSTLFFVFFCSCLFSFAQNISSVNPTTGEQGTPTLPVTISGVNTNFDQATITYIEFNQASSTTLSVINVSSVTATSIDLDLQIKTIDNTGFYDVAFYGISPQGSMQYSLNQGFEVLPTNLPPQIVMSSPQTTTLNQLFNINVGASGTHFTQATSTSVWFSQGTSTTVYPSSQQTNNDTSIIANFQVSSLSFAIGDTLDLNLYNGFDGYIFKPSALVITPSYSIAGNVFGPTGSPFACKVELYQKTVSYNSQTSYILFDSTFAVNGGYAFGNVPDDYFIVRAVPDEQSGVSSAYYNSNNPGVQLWTDAEELTSSSAQVYNIYLTDASSQLGTASISGTLSSSDGFTKMYTPVQNARITCSGLSTFYETQTNAFGAYSLDGLPYDTYTVFVDIPGKTHVNSLSTITLSATNESVSNNDYLIYQDQIIRSFTSVDEKNLQLAVKIYPNPSSDYVYFETSEPLTNKILFSLFDVNGRLINTFSSPDNITKIDIKTIAKGKYFLSGIINGKVWVAQIVKE